MTKWIVKRTFLTGVPLTVLFNGHRETLPFETKRIFPTNHLIKPSDYFYGRGERTLYFLTRFEGSAKDKKWLCIGANGYVRVWHNKKLIYTSDQVRRSWPMTHNSEINVTAQNEIMIRVDYPVDDFDITIGFKKHLEKHAHQSQWDPELIPLG